MSSFLLKVFGFCSMASISGLAYIKYLSYEQINDNLNQLESEGKLKQYLYNLSQQAAYTNDFRMDSFEAYYSKNKIQKYRATLVAQATGKVLETCAGTNRNLAFYPPNISLTLIDNSPNMQLMGSEKISPYLKYDYVEGDVMNMPFEDNTFDTVVDTFGLQYVIDPSKALSQIRRVCKTNGKIILINQGLSSIVEFHYWENLVSGKALMKGGYFSNRNWDKLVKSFDFQVVHEERKKNGKIYIYILKNIKNKLITEQHQAQPEQPQSQQLREQAISQVK